MGKKIAVRATWDYKSGQRAQDSILYAIKRVGPKEGPIFIYLDHGCDGSDAFGLIISKKALSEKKIEECSEYGEI